MVIRDQEEAQDQFERNLRILTASRLKGTETEIDARKKVRSYRIFLSEQTLDWINTPYTQLLAIGKGKVIMLLPLLSDVS